MRNVNVEKRKEKSRARVLKGSGYRIGRCCFLVLTVSLLLSSCAAFPFTHEIESTVLMRTLGVDVGTASVDGVAVTASSAGRPGAGTQKPEPAVILSAQGDTVTAACQRIQTQGDQYVFYGDVEQLLVGEGLAQRSLTALLTHVGRDRELRLEARLWVVRGAAADVLFPAAEGKGAADRLDAMEEDAGLFSNALPKTAREALVELHRNGCTFVPALATAPSRPGDGAEGEAAIRPAGYAIFRDGALVGWTDAQASRGVNLLLGKVDTDILEVTTPDCSRVALKISKARVKYRPAVEEGRLVGLAVLCDVEADVAERRGDCVLNAATLTWLERELAEATQSRMEQTLNQAQDLNADYLSLASKAALAAPWHKEILNAQWDDAFSILPISVTVRGTVARE